jgi:hypothetical protein
MPRQSDIAHAMCALEALLRRQCRREPKERRRLREEAGQYWVFGLHYNRFAKERSVQAFPAAISGGICSISLEPPLTRFATHAV